MGFSGMGTPNVKPMGGAWLSGNRAAGGSFWTPHWGGQNWYTGDGQVIPVAADPEAAWREMKGPGALPYRWSSNEQQAQYAGQKGGRGGAGSPFAGGGQGGRPGGMSYSSAIAAGPAIPQADVNAAMGRLQSAPQLPPATTPAGEALQQQYMDLYNPAAQSAATDLGRDTAYSNAQHQLASEQARARSGLGMANYLAGQDRQRIDAQQPGLQLLSLFASLLGG